MKKVLIFAGTTEGRVLAKRLEAAGVFCEVCVATQYGEQLLEESGNLMVRRGRLDAGQMRELYGEQEYAAVVDATHPFAAVVTENILESLKGKEIPYFRLARDVKTELGELPDCLFFETAAECAAALEKVPGNILLTTGSKELSLFCSKESLRKRLIVRVLPGMESLELCIKNGLEGRQIIAMQGPFTKEMNLAMFHQYGIACLVTKESGRTGGVDEKLEAALEAKIPCCMIRRPQTAEKIREDSPEEVWQQLKKLLDIRESSCAGLDIVLAGIGMGCEETMTMQLVNRIQETDYLFGAERMIRAFCPKKEKFPYYLAGDIIPKLKQLQKENQGTLRVTILFSGDTGFFSGCEKLHASLKELENTTVRVYPGISSVAALGAAFAVSWQDASIVSTHGEKREKWSTEILYEVRHERKVFFLTSGPEDVRAVGKLLEDNGYADSCRMLIGYQLCYPEEETYDLLPRECGQIQSPGLYCGMILPGKRTAGPAEWTENSICPGIPDEAFLREKVPMTKEEIREISVCKLAPGRDAVIYDIGSGTGSIAVQLALLSPKIRVFAVESQPEAAALIRRNREKFGAENMEVIESLAPDNMEELPAATHAFIGGSRGRMQEILEFLYRKNPHMRVVVNAVTLESICAMRECMDRFPMTDMEIVTVSVSRAKQAGAYHLMQANNPVTIFSFTFTE